VLDEGEEWGDRNVVGLASFARVKKRGVPVKGVEKEWGKKEEGKPRRVM